MYGSGPQVLGVQLPNTGDNWVMTAAAIVTLVAGAVIIASTIAFVVAKKAHKA
jgi:LPXTG-motif cell wall-anchored protein